MYMIIQLIDKEVMIDDRQPELQYIIDETDPDTNQQAKRDKDKQIKALTTPYHDQNFTFKAIDPSKQNRTQLNLNPYDPKKKYLTVYSGLNIKGTCQNVDCIANKKHVWIKKGYGTIDFAIARYGNQCPCCQTKMQATSFVLLGFRQAKVKFEGKRVNNNGQLEDFVEEDEQKNGRFVTFRQLQHKMFEWISLKIIVQKN